MYVLEEVVTRARAHLVENGYSGSTIGHYVSVWRRLSEWCAENAPDGYDGDVGRRYLEDAGLMQDDLPSKQQRFVRRAVERLVEVAETGAPAKPEAPRKYVVPTGLVPAYELYAAELSRRGLRATTVSSYLSTARHFLATCGASSSARSSSSSPVGICSSTRLRLD